MQPVTGQVITVPSSVDKIQTEILTRISIAIDVVRIAQ